VRPREEFDSFARNEKARRAAGCLPPAMYLRPCAMYFAQKGIASTSAGIIHDGSTTRLLYSIHSGYEELRRFVRGLSVREVQPFNAPLGCAPHLSRATCTCAQVQQQRQSGAGQCVSPHPWGQCGRAARAELVRRLP